MHFVVNHTSASSFPLKLKLASVAGGSKKLEYPSSRINMQNMSGLIYIFDLFDLGRMPKAYRGLYVYRVWC